MLWHALLFEIRRLETHPCGRRQAIKPDCHQQWSPSQIILFLQNGSAKSRILYSALPTIPHAPVNFTDFKHFILQGHDRRCSYAGVTLFFPSSLQLLSGDLYQLTSSVTWGSRGNGYWQQEDILQPTRGIYHSRLSIPLPQRRNSQGRYHYSLCRPAQATTKRVFIIGKGARTDYPYLWWLPRWGEGLHLHLVGAIKPWRQYRLLWVGKQDQCERHPCL